MLHRAALIAILLFGAALALGEEVQGSGWIRARCSEGVRIFVDGKLRGICKEATQGLVIERMAVGVHLIVAEKAGFKPIEIAGHVHLNLVSEIDAQPFELLLPDRKDSEEREGPKEGSTAFGGLRLQSIPERIAISSLFLEWTAVEKVTDEWSAEVPEGTYRITFTSGKSTLSHVVHIKNERDVFLMVDFDEQRVIELNAIGHEPGDARFDAKIACYEGTLSNQTWPSPGWVTIDARPHAEVFQETRKLGDTPLAHAVLPAGCVRLKFVELDSKKEYQRYVWIEPNQEVAYRCAQELDACEQPAGRP